MTGGGDNSQDTDFVSPGNFELLELINKKIYTYLFMSFHYFIISVCPWLSIDRDVSWS